MNGEEFIKVGRPLRLAQVRAEQLLWALRPGVNPQVRADLQREYDDAVAAVNDHIRDFLRGDEGSR